MGISRFFVGRERKGQAAFSPLVLLGGSEGVGQDRNGKPSHADRRSVSARGGSEWKVDRLPQGLGVYFGCIKIILYRMKSVTISTPLYIYINIYVYKALV